MHVSKKHHAEAASDRTTLTVVTQMMLHVWESYIEMCDPKVKAELQMDDDEVYRMMLKAKFEEQDEEYDTYDPFGEIDTEGRDIKAPANGVTETSENELAATRAFVA